LNGKETPEIFLAAALVSHFNRQGHICLDLKKIEGKQIFTEGDGRILSCPPLASWLEHLRNNSVIGVPGEFKPLILDENSKLYLYRYWEYQDRLARMINDRVLNNETTVDLNIVSKSLDQYFPPLSNNEADWQRIAAFIALKKRFCVISGGPGTGKTTTIAKIMAFLQELHQSNPLRIALASPTGKAAARLQEAIKITKASLNCSTQIKQLIPEKTATIHRLLSTIPDSPYFRYNAKNLLPIDVMIVDEASMVDLALMSKLVQALPPSCRLILVGDRDQLASVEAGAVLGDICDTGNQHGYSRQLLEQIETIAGNQINQSDDKQRENGLQDCIIELKKSYRFGSDSGISAVTQAVNRGDGEQTMQLLQRGCYSDVEWIPLPPANRFASAMRDKIIAGFKDYLEADNPIDTFQQFDRFRILCALREGPYGMKTMNAMAANILKDEGLIHPQQLWYHGRPIMITSNDYQLNLFNGDVGIALKDVDSNNDMRVFFIDTDNAIKKFHPLRLPAHETVFAMTVHKSQGSEFDHVLLLLSHRDSPVLTRELIYTGLTRARKKVEIWGAEQIFKNAVVRRIERTSGLRDALWECF
jgi:exodeoxyribonuclease V alpha subunit